MGRDRSGMRVWPAAPWRRNPLLRLSDRVEGLIRLLAVLAVLAAAPMAIGAGLAGYHSAESRIRSDNATKTSVQAVITTAPVRSSAGQEGAAHLLEAHARWERPNGSGEAVIDVLGSAQAGDRTTLWLGPDGRPTTPPLTHDVAVVQGIGAGLLTVIAAATGAGVIVWTTGRLLAHRRAAAWDHEWRLVSPALGRDKQ